MVGCPRFFKMSRSWTLPSLNETNLWALFITTGWKSFSFAWLGSRHLFIVEKICLALMIPKSSNVLHRFWFCSGLLIGGIFCNSRYCVQQFAGLSWKIAALFPTLRLRDRFSVCNASFFLQFQFENYHCRLKTPHGNFFGCSRKNNDVVNFEEVLLCFC